MFSMVTVAVDKDPTATRPERHDVDGCRRLSTMTEHRSDTGMEIR